MKNILWSIVANGPAVCAHSIGVCSILAVSYLQNSFWVGIFDFSDLSGFLFFPSVYILGMFLGFIFVWPWIRLFALKNNGYPFKNGDFVKVLCGKFKNKEGYIYEILIDRKQIRVDFGDDVKNKFEDIYQEHQIKKI